MSPSARTADAVLDRLAAVPGGSELLAVGRERNDLFLVGGAVRDLLLGGAPHELDVVVEGDVTDAAAAVAARLPGVVTAHERFGTASLQTAEARVDLAGARTESYAHPGSLPDVQPATLAEDLARRDFTVNAIAVPLGDEADPALRSVPEALDDLDAGRLRVLHDASFVDDPTRLLRLARYSARLGFEVEELTAELARRALGDGALETLSGGRAGAELRLLLAEPDPVAALAAAARTGVLSHLHPSLDWDEALARRVLALVPGEADPALGLLAACAIAGEPADLAAWLDRLEFGARERDVVVAAATRAKRMATALEAAVRPSEIAAAVRGAPLEAVALAGALGPSGQASAWLDELRHTRLSIDGDDLLATGIGAGPALGRALDAALAARLDGQLAPGPEAELAFAVEAAGADAE